MCARPVLTAEDIRMAKQACLTSVVIPIGAIVTQQAREDALQHGITLVSAHDAEQAAIASPAMPQATVAPQATVTPQATVASQATVVPQAAAMAQVSAPSACSNACKNKPADSLIDEGLFDSIRRQTLAALPANIDPAMVDESIRKTLAALKGDGGGCAHCPTHEAQTKAGAPAWLLEGGGVRLVNSSALNFSSGGTGNVGIMQVLGGENTSQVGYLKFDSGSFSWTFEQAQTLIVLEGSLNFTANGIFFKAHAGDVCAFPAGSEVLFEADGPVRCATVGM